MKKLTLFSWNAERMHAGYILMKTRSETKENYMFIWENKEIVVERISNVSSFKMTCILVKRNLPSKHAAKSEIKYVGKIYAS